MTLRMARRKNNFDLLAAKTQFATGGGPRKRGTRIAIIVALVLVAVAALFVYPLYKMSLSVYSHADAGRSELQLAEDAASRLDLRLARSHAALASQQFVEARGELDRFSAFRGFPRAARGC